MIGGVQMKKKIIACIIVTVLLIGQLSAFAFNDVPKDHWAKDVINKMTDLKIINGYDANTFGPEDAVRRIDALLLVSRILGASDSNQSEFVDAAYLKYFPNVNVLGYSSYEKNLAYLLYRNVFTTSDLKSFVANSMGDKGLKRYEAAIIMVKLMGAEEKVKANTMPMLSFDDSSSIPAEAKAYVEYCAENGLMKGMENNTFSPNTTVTRAQMATMLNTGMQKLDLTYSTGFVTNVNSMTDKITYQDKDGNEKSIALAGDIAATCDGEILSDIDDVEKGMKINVVYSGANLYAIELATVVSDNVYKGIMVGTVIGSSSQSIKIKEDMSVSKVLTFELADSCTVTYESGATTLGKLPKECSVKVTVKDSKAVSIEATNSSEKLSGTITNFVYDTPALMSIKSSDGNITSYEFADGAEIKKNSKDASVIDLLVGDKVTITLKYNKIQAVTATSSNKNIKGKITKIVIADSSYITIKNGNSELECAVNTVKSPDITINGSPASIYDLKLGYEAEVELESNTVKGIKITEVVVGTEESAAITGTVVAIDKNFNFLTVDCSDGQRRQIFANNSTYIIDSATTKVKKFSTIKAGDKISATATSSDNQTLVAITIVIM